MAAESAQPAGPFAPIPPAPSRFDLELAERRDLPGGIRAFRHTYHRHPLMQLDALEELAQRLAPSMQCRFMRPQTDPSVPFEHGPRPHDGRSIGEVFRRLHEPGSWIALYDVQTDPAYRDFVWDVLRSASALWPVDEVLDVRGFAFLSAPPSVTPFHIDGENNFWMQLHGRKTMHVWDRNDARVVSDRDVENFVIHRSLDNVRLDADKLERNLVFDCGPGDGVFFPSTTPHMTRSTVDWVRPDDPITVSIGVVFYTRGTLREARAHACNHLLRTAGLSPRRIGLSPRLDRMKALPGQLAVLAARRLRGYQPTSSFTSAASLPTKRP